MRSGAVLILTSMLLVTPQSSRASDELVREFEEIERRRSHALKVADLAALDRLYDGAFVGISAAGDLVRKDDLIRNVRARGSQDTTFTAHELEVRLVDGVALVVGRIVGKDTGGKVIREGRFLHVYGRSGQGWKLLAAQATPIPRVGDEAG